MLIALLLTFHLPEGGQYLVQKEQYEDGIAADHAKERESFVYFNNTADESAIYMPATNGPMVKFGEVYLERKLGVQR